MTPFSLFICIWFQGWPLYIGQSIEELTLGKGKFCFSQLSIIGCVLYLRTFTPSILHAHCHYNCSGLPYAIISKDDYFTADFVVFWLLQALCPPPRPNFLNVSWATDAQICKVDASVWCIRMTLWGTESCRQQRHPVSVFTHMTSFTSAFESSLTQLKRCY